MRKCRRLRPWRGVAWRGVAWRLHGRMAAERLAYPARVDAAYAAPLYRTTRAKTKRMALPIPNTLPPTTVSCTLVSPVHFRGLSRGISANGRFFEGC